MTKKKKMENMRTFVRAYDKYKDIENDKDLKKNKLTLSDYQIVGECLESLSKVQEGDKFVTFVTEVANWFKALGFSVTMDYNNINYIISLNW